MREDKDVVEKTRPMWSGECSGLWLPGSAAQSQPGLTPRRGRMSDGHKNIQMFGLLQISPPSKEGTCFCFQTEETGGRQIPASFITCLYRPLPEAD